MKKLTSTLLSILFAVTISAQTIPFKVHIEPLSLQGLGGLQSYAYAQHNGKWLILGGRLDGLHRRQPFASFDIAGHNTSIIVVDPDSGIVKYQSMTSLPINIREPLSSTNMEYYQRENVLYCIGGYGYSTVGADHTTFNTLTAIDVPGLIQAILSNQDINGFFRQINHSSLQVTGGRLRMIDTSFYLLGGQKFIGRYNPMGPDHGPGFFQEYTNSIIKFDILDDMQNLSIYNLSKLSDSLELHRRDYNAESQIMPDGKQGITMFSGVFRPDVDLPYQNSVDVGKENYSINANFKQYYNHYHCPVAPLYSASENSMYNIFFGGIAQFYDSMGTMVQDNNVPFVNTIATVSRDENGILAETKMESVMPSLLGAGAEFIPLKSFGEYENGVLPLDSFDTDTALIGYIYGGILSTAPNIFFINTGVESSATSIIYKVFLTKGETVGLGEIKKNEESYNLVVYPNPGYGDLRLSFTLSGQEDIELTLIDEYGRILSREQIQHMEPGRHTLKLDIADDVNFRVLYVNLEIAGQQITRKVVIER